MGILVVTVALTTTVGSITAQADAAHDYYTALTTVPTSGEPPQYWQAFNSALPTAADYTAPGTTFECGGSPTGALLSAKTAGGSGAGQVNGVCAGGTADGGGTVLSDVLQYNRTGPFPGDVNEGALQMEGQLGTTSPWAIGPSEIGGTSVDSEFTTFWFKPVVAWPLGASTFTVWASAVVGTHHAHQPEGDYYTLAPGESQLYILSHDNFAHICFGQWGGSDAVSGFSSMTGTEHCVPYDHLGAWHMLSIYYQGAASGSQTAAVTLGIDDHIAHKLTGLYPRAVGVGQAVVGSAGATVKYQADVWGWGRWLDASADDMMSTSAPCGGPSTPNGCLPVLFYGAGTGELPTGTYAGPGLPPGGNVGCATRGVISQSCKFQIGQIAMTDCAVVAAGHNWWDVGADVTTALCYLGNIVITAVNYVLDGINAVIDLLLPSDQLAQPVLSLWSFLQGKAPFGYVVAGLTAFGDALGASATGTTVAWHVAGHTWDMDFTQVAAPLESFRTPLVAAIWLAAVIGVVMAAREDITK